MTVAVSQKVWDAKIVAFGFHARWRDILNRECVKSDAPIVN